MTLPLLEGRARCGVQDQSACDVVDALLVRDVVGAGLVDRGDVVLGLVLRGGRRGRRGDEGRRR